MSDADVERKLAAILSADVVGYSRLMGDDDHATLATLTEYREVMREHITSRRGRVVDSPGDALLAEFPSAVQAVEASIAIQQELARRNDELPEHRRMLMRIGINLGDVIEQDGALYGDGVNIAARLEALSESGGICISGTVFDQIENKVDAPIKFAGRQSVKNIAKPVRAYYVSTGSKGSTGLARRRRIVKGAVLLTAVVALAGATAWLAWQPTSKAPIPVVDPVLSIPKGPSIAVLPFSNLTGDAKQDALADGITEDLITALSRFPDLFVIARNSTLKYKGKAVDLRDVGKDLGVRYVLEGSVQGADDQVRVTAQLIDTQTGGHVWAEAFTLDMSGTNLFDIQDEITERVAVQIASGYGVLSRLGAARTRGARPTDIDAYSCVLKARAYYRVFTESEHLEARSCLESVTQTYPDYSEALAWLALMYLDEFRYSYNLSTARPQPLDTALEYAGQAVRANPTDQYTWHALAKIHYFSGNVDQFYIAADKALKLNPNNVQTLSDLGFFMGLAGEWERGTAIVRKAMTLDPYYPGWYHFLFFYDHYRKREYDQALSEALRINTPGLFFHHVVHAAAYGQLGRTEEARKAVRDLLEIYPDFPEHMRDEYRKYNFSEALIEHVAQGLEKAELPIPE
jgi:adenylate cyclase